MAESQELFEPSQIDEDELINQLLNEENEGLNETSTQNEEMLQVGTSPVRAPLLRNTGFPLSRIKTLIKMDPDVGLVSAESVYVIAKAAELFLKNLAKETYNYTAKAKRKTVQRKDVDAAIENVDALCFLEGALDT